MTREDYIYELTDDIKRWMDDNDWVSSGDKDDDYENLNDALWVEDSVTGNASGSYTFSRSKALENIDGAEDVIEDMIQEGWVDKDTIAEHFLDWEYWDVSIRCYLLGEAIDMALDELEVE